MDPGHIFRRLFHLCGPAILIYYLLPDRVFHLPREAWLLFGLALLLTIEIVRLARGKVFFGLREYEGRQISAYAWAGMGATVAFLFFPPALVVCAICGLCWVDPLIGEMRRRRSMRHYPGLPILAYDLITWTLLVLMTEMGWIAVTALAAVGAISAISIERQQRLPIDDDFLMLVIPLLVMTAVLEYLTFAGFTTL